MDGTGDENLGLAALVRKALTTLDLDAFGALLHDNVRWGTDDHPRRCRSRSEVLATLRRAVDDGARAEVTEVTGGSTGLLCGFVVHWPASGGPARRRRLFHVYVVHEGRIAEIKPFTDRASAALAAGAA